MLTLPLLNRRHKAGVFLVLVATGLSLFFEASAKQTAGIVLLGSAATWFFGSVRPRTLGLIILASTACCAGLYLMLPVWGERESYYVQAAEYDQVLLDIREAVGKAVVWDIEPPEKTPKRTVQIPEIAQKWERLTPEERNGGWMTVELSFPVEMSEQDIIREFQTKILLPKPTFSFRAAIRSHLLSSVAGSLLFLLGLLGWMLFVWQALRRKRPENATQSA